MTQDAARRALKKWFPFSEEPAPGLPLYALPHAGGGASAYRGWIAELAPAIRVVPVQLPGREGRFGEPLPASLPALAAEAARAVLGHTPDGPFALFGHSMGALVAYELATALAAAGRAPTALVVSGFRAPQLLRDRLGVHLMTDGQLREHLRALGGSQSEILDDAAMLELLAPTIRADYRMCDDYVCGYHPPLELPVSAIGGTNDSRVSAEHLQAWQMVTTGPFRTRRFPGGHFYLRDQRDEVLEFLAEELMGIHR
ncbi:medium-chain acyl-[acyl-carrier-protein] hydrolase [Catenulispora sp. GP43]|uniref:thioesterase II family protein n=1 Tax=Catenulispora sp. GP43 TaxID=3156263 RepID=UPI003511BD16